MGTFSTMIRTGLLGGALALFGAGCNNGDAAKDEEITRLNAIIANYDKENRALMERLEKGTGSGAQYELELAAQQRQIDLLRKALSEKKGGTLDLSAAQIQKLQAIANELGGTLVGNRIQLPGDVLFSTGSWSLKPTAQASLKKLSDALQKEDFGLMIVGHTDDQPIKKLLAKGIGSNRHLSLMRSLAVTNYMSKDCGYPADKLLPAGWGELKPQVDNKSNGGQARNRRVEIFIDPDMSNLTMQAAAIGVSGAEGAMTAPAEETASPSEVTAPMEK